MIEETLRMFGAMAIGTIIGWTGRKTIIEFHKVTHDRSAGGT